MTFRISLINDLSTSGTPDEAVQPKKQTHYLDCLAAS
jgi:hypothetical protein